MHHPLLTERRGPSLTALGDAGTAQEMGWDLSKETQQQQASLLFYREKEP